MRFLVIDTETGGEADMYNIALKEEWAKHLCYCDMEGFSILEDGTLLLNDECGNAAYCPEGRFEIVPEINTNGDMIRAMTDKQLATFMYETDWNGGCPMGMFFTEASCLSSSCHECWEDWLKQEVDDGSTK